MKILVTGGCGYLGTSLIHQLLESSEVEEVRVYDNLSRGLHTFFLGERSFDSRVRFIEADILDSRRLAQAMDCVDVVYHLAAKVSDQFSNQNTHVYEQINHWGTAELTYAIERSDVSQLVYLSSSSAYGASEDLLTEDAVLRPESVYGVSKMRGESHVRRLFRNLKSCQIIRCANVFGYSRSMRMDGVINRFLFDANFKRKITVHGDVSQSRSFVHIDRASRIVAALAESELETGIYNLADRVLNLNDLIEALLKIFQDMELIYADQDQPKRDVKLAEHPKLAGLDECPPLSLTHALEEFKDRLAF